jgi:cytosine/adenosine deaminase-related metal-dependent hydrolase
MSSTSSPRRSSGEGCTHARQTWALAPSAPQRCSHELLEGIAALSRQHGLPVFTHVYETRIQAAAARKDPSALRSLTCWRAPA